METGDDPKARSRHVLARRSTWAGLGGVVLMLAGLLLTPAHPIGYVVPTVLFVVGLGSLMAGVATGTMQIIDRYRRSDTDFDR